MTTALEHRTPGKGTLDFEDAKRYSVVLAKSELVPKALQGNPDGVMLVGLLGQELGVPFVSALSEIHVIEGRPSPSAQLRLALIRRAGHEARFLESSEIVAVIRARRAEDRNDPDAWVTVRWTIEQARKAGLLDRTVEEWRVPPGGDRKKLVKEVVGDDTGIFDEVARRQRGMAPALPEWAQKLLDAGQVKSKDNWLKYPAEMLRARCSSAVCRMHFSDVLLGMGAGELDAFTAEERGHDVGQDVDDVPHQDDDIIDIEPEPEGTEDHDGPVGEAEPVTDPGDDDGPGDEQQDDDGPGDEQQEAPADEGAEPSPPVGPPDEPEPPADDLISNRQKQDWAVAAKAAGLTEEQRHEIVHLVTAGRTRTSKELRKSEFPALFRWLDNVLEGSHHFVKLSDGNEVLVPRSAEGGPAAGDSRLQESA